MVEGLPHVIEIEMGDKVQVQTVDYVSISYWCGRCRVYGQVKEEHSQTFYSKVRNLKGWKTILSRSCHDKQEGEKKS